MYIKYSISILSHNKTSNNNSILLYWHIRVQQYKNTIKLKFFHWKQPCIKVSWYIFMQRKTFAHLFTYSLTLKKLFTVSKLKVCSQISDWHENTVHCLLRNVPVPLCFIVFFIITIFNRTFVSCQVYPWQTFQWVHFFPYSSTRETWDHHSFIHRGKYCGYSNSKQMYVLHGTYCGICEDCRMQVLEVCANSSYFKLFLQI